MTARAYERALHRLLEVPSSPRFGLERMAALLDELGAPQRAFAALHVAGTNGKGSVCAMVEAMLRADGVRTGLTTSPHLTSARERIVVDGAPVDEATFVALESRVYEAAQALGDDPPTFFERMIAMAFLAFKDAGVEVAVVEVGLGGRLDATNVITPHACAIVSIGLDHQEFLGETVVDIAREKAGIVKPGVDVVVSRSIEGPALAAIVELATKRGAMTVAAWDYAVVDDEDGRVRVVRNGVERVSATRLALSGPHQRENLEVAVALLASARRMPAPDVAARALAQVAWPGRYEWLDDDGPMILDGAHNPDGARALSRALARDPRVGARPVVLVVGATRGHDPEAFARALDDAGGAPAFVVATMARAPRSQPASAVAGGHAAVWGEERVVAVLGPEAALARARAHAATTGAVVVVTGSLYLVGELRAPRRGMVVDPALPLF